MVKIVFYLNNGDIIAIRMITMIVIIISKVMIMIIIIAEERIVMSGLKKVL